MSFISGQNSPDSTPHVTTCSSPHASPITSPIISRKSATVNWDQVKKTKNDTIDKAADLVKPVLKMTAEIGTELSGERLKEKAQKNLPPVTNMTKEINAILAKTSSFAEVQTIAMKAYPKTTFWGKRFICVKGFEDRLTIDSLAAKTIELLKQNPEYDTDEREALRILTNRINKLYKLSNKDLRCKNCMTRLFALIRGTLRYLQEAHSIKYLWVTDYCNAHEQYSTSQYIKAFGHNPPGSDLRCTWTVPSHIEP